MAEYTYFLGRSAALKKQIDAIEDKKWLFETYRDYMYTRLLAMFEYKNLPESLPNEILEYYLLSNGTCFITKVNDKIYAFLGSMGGEPDPYYRPSKYIVANPALNLSKEYDWKTDGVLMRNDKLWIGLENLVTRYAAFMAENGLSIRVADILLRIVALLSAPDDATKESANDYLKKVIDGKIGVIGETPFFDGIKMQSPPSNNGSYLTQFIELHQYFKGSFYNEIGLNANFNMKREAIGKGEASLSQDSLLPLCDTMLACRKEDIEKINQMYGTNIEVEFASAWRSNQIEAKLELDKLQAEASQLEEEGEIIERTNQGNAEGNKETPDPTEEVAEDGECGRGEESGEGNFSLQAESERDEGEVESGDSDTEEGSEDRRKQVSGNESAELQVCVNVTTEIHEEKENIGDSEEREEIKEEGDADDSAQEGENVD